MMIHKNRFGRKHSNKQVQPLCVFILTHSVDLRAGMLADVTNHRLSDILIQHTHIHGHTLSQIHRENKASSQGNGALTLRPRPSVASSEGRWHSHREMDGWMDRGREREQMRRRRRGVSTSHRGLKHSGAEIRFGSNDIMLLTGFSLLVPTQHKFHWSHMESGLLLNTTWCVSAGVGPTMGHFGVCLLALCHFTMFRFF